MLLLYLLRMYKLLIYILPLLLAIDIDAQVNAPISFKYKKVEDGFYINYKVGTHENCEFKQGDTVIAYYHVKSSFTEKLLLKAESVFKVSAVVIETDCSNGIISGLQVAVYSIKRFYKNDKREVTEFTYTRHRKHFNISVGDTLWRDAFYWVNTTGFYKINKITDNYRVGDTLLTCFECKRFAGNKSLAVCNITAVLTAIDSAEKPMLQLKVLEIEMHQNDITKNVTQIKHGGVVYNTYQKVWADPHWWSRQGYAPMYFYKYGEPRLTYKIRHCTGVWILIYEQ